MSRAVPHNERAHALLSASGSAMWLACPPSARLNEAEPEQTSEYAEEGTLGHELVQARLSFMVGEIRQAEHDDRMRELQAHRLFTDDLAIAAETCVRRGWEFILEATRAHPDTLVLLEHRLDYSRWVPEGFGTGDLVIVTPECVHTIDWKFGQGEWVDAVGNTQLRLYAAAALDMFGPIYGSRRVRATVVQPRVGNIASEEMNAAELLGWMHEVVEPAALLAWDGKGKFNPGAKQCRWCKVRGKCRARAEANLATAADDFLEPALMSDDQIAALYPELDELITWAHDVQDHADKRVLAGAQLPGLKAVMGRSNRVISDHCEALRLLTQRGGYTFDEVALPEVKERILKPLTQLEKICGAAGLKEILGDLITKPPGKVIVVPVDDKRTAIDMSSATPEEDFANTPV